MRAGLSSCAENRTDIAANFVRSGVQRTESPPPDYGARKHKSRAIRAKDAEKGGEKTGPKDPRRLVFRFAQHVHGLTS